MSGFAKSTLLLPRHCDYFLVKAMGIVNAWPRQPTLTYSTAVLLAVIIKLKIIPL
jgi:hypothetical protein